MPRSDGGRAGAPRTSLPTSVAGAFVAVLAVAGARGFAVLASAAEAQVDSPLFSATNAVANRTQDRMTLVVGEDPFAVLESSRCGNCPREHWSAVPASGRRAAASQTEHAAGPAGPGEVPR